MAGKNLFGYSQSDRILEKYAGGPKRPCVFVSHSSKDKPAAREVAAWLKLRDLNVYFDENDVCLKAAMHLGEPQAIVKCIQDGLDKSDYALCVMSNHVLESQWVPYEMGYFQSGKENQLSILLLSEVTSVPQFYKVANVLPDYEALDTWIDAILEGTTVLQESKMLKRAHYNAHPLTNVVSRSKTVTWK